MANLFLNQIYFDSLKYININISHGNLCFAKSCGKYFESLIWNSYKAITFPNIYIIYHYICFSSFYIYKRSGCDQRMKRDTNAHACYVSFFSSSCSSIEKKALVFPSDDIYFYIYTLYIWDKTQLETLNKIQKFSVTSCFWTSIKDDNFIINSNS